MKHFRTIDEILESWGGGKRELPKANSVLKERILAKVPTTATFVPEQPRAIGSPYMWSSFVFTALAIITLFLNVNHRRVVYNTIGTDTQIVAPTNFSVVSPQAKTSRNISGTTSGMTFSGTAPSDLNSERDTALPYRPELQYKTSVPLSDNREFEKINYNARVKTRDVTDTQTRIEILVRGFGGRVDDSASGEKAGFISFVIPKNNLEAFKLEVKDLVGKKFYEENIASQNFLAQKQNIEQNQQATQNSLANLKTERSSLVKNHTEVISAYQKNRDYINAEIAALNYEYPNATPARKIEIENKIRELQGEINSLNLQITQENNNYQSRLANIDWQIKNAQNNLVDLGKQDQNLIEDVATVNGSISLDWISFFEMSDIYVPGPLFTEIFVFLAILSYLYYRRTARIYDYY